MIHLRFDPASPHSVDDLRTREEAVMKAYHMMETLAYLDRQATDIRDAAQERAKGASKTLGKQLNSVSIRMDSLHLKMVVMKEGKVIGEEKLREKLGFLYGSILSYKGRPTDTQLNGLNEQAEEVEKISAEVAQFKTKEFPDLNQALVKANQKEIKVVSWEDFRKEE